MRSYIFDIETNGLLDELTKVHSLVLMDRDTGKVTSCCDQPAVKWTLDGDVSLHYTSVEEGLKMMMEADELIGHNIIKFDVPALHKVYPWFTPSADLVDTLVLTRLIWSDIKDSDFGRVKKRKLPGKLIGSHGLEAWGYRLGCWKGDYSKDKAEEIKEGFKARGEKPLKMDEINRLVWANWSVEMQDYCVQDVEVTKRLYDTCTAKNYPPMAIELEHRTALLCAQIERNGFPFDEAGGGSLYARLAQRRNELEAGLKETFGFWYEDGGLVNPSRTVRYKDPDQQDRVKGEPWTKLKLVFFNPASRDHIAHCLKVRYGWKPKEFTPAGKPKVDEEVLAGIDWPEAKQLTEYFLLQKRIGQLAEGNQAWLKVCRDGFIYGSINTNNAVTGRATHSYPNVGQVPGNKALYGKECRSLFGITEAVKRRWPDAIMVGTDKSGLELRCLAHFMAAWDGGLYGQLILQGDIHWANVIALGLVPEGTERKNPDGSENPIHELFRNSAKTFIYGFLYGAGDLKIGRILYEAALREEALGLGNSIRTAFFSGKRQVTEAMMKALGKRLKANFLAGFPALKTLIDKVQAKAKRTGFIFGLDRRLVSVRKAFASLNTLLQSAGALACKRWIIELDKALRDEGFVHGWDGDYAIVAWVHDELQIICKNKEVARVIERLSPIAARETGEYFNFKCELGADCEGIEGNAHNWSETH